MEKLPENYTAFNIEVDESKRPKECRDLMGVYKDLQISMGTSGTYTKLNQDEI